MSQAVKLSLARKVKEMTKAEEKRILEEQEADPEICATVLEEVEY